MCSQQLILDAFLNKDYEGYLSLLYTSLSELPENEKNELYSRILFIIAHNLKELKTNRAYLQIMCQLYKPEKFIQIHDMASAILHMIVAFVTGQEQKPFSFAISQTRLSQDVFRLPLVRIEYSQEMIQTLPKIYIDFYEKWFDRSISSKPSKRNISMHCFSLFEDF